MYLYVLNFFIYYLYNCIGFVICFICKNKGNWRIYCNCCFKFIIYEGIINIFCFV